MKGTPQLLWFSPKGSGLHRVFVRHPLPVDPHALFPPKTSCMGSPLFSWLDGRRAAPSPGPRDSRSFAPHRGPWNCGELSSRAPRGGPPAHPSPGNFTFAPSIHHLSASRRARASRMCPHPLRQSGGRTSLKTPSLLHSPFIPSPSLQHLPSPLHLPHHITPSPDSFLSPHVADEAEK